MRNFLVFLSFISLTIGSPLDGKRSSMKRGDTRRIYIRDTGDRGDRGQNRDDTGVHSGEHDGGPQGIYIRGTQMDMPEIDKSIFNESIQDKRKKACEPGETQLDGEKKNCQEFKSIEADRLQPLIFKTFILFQIFRTFSKHF